MADNEGFIPEELEEEERIMAERAKAPRALDASTMKAPIRTLPLAQPVTVGPSTSIHDAIEAMQKGHFGCVLVAEAGKLVGIFTERDVLFKLALKGRDWKTTKISEFMTAKPESLPHDASLAFALNMMSEGGFRHIPIVDRDHKPIAVLSMKDVVRYICGFFEKEVKNLPPRPGLLHPTKDGG